MGVLNQPPSDIRVSSSLSSDRSNMCSKMYNYFRNIYDQKSWWSKFLAVVVVICYFAAVIAIHDQPYLWLTLTFAVILCLTTLACSRDDPIIAFRRGGLTPRASISEDQGPPPLEIWVTDIPPTYSFVMANATPPPSYGSAIFKFPAVAAAAEKLEKTEGIHNTNSTPMLRRVLDPNRFRSVSRQVSEIGRLSRQVSESGIGRLSRQSSVNALETEEVNEDWESGIVIIVPPRIRRTVSQSSDVFSVIRQSEGQSDPSDREETLENSQADHRPSEPAAQDVSSERIGSSTVFTCSMDGTKRTVIVVNVSDFDQRDDSESGHSGIVNIQPDDHAKVTTECETNEPPNTPEK